MFKYLDTKQYNNIDEQQFICDCCHFDTENRENNIKNSQGSTIFDF